MRSVIAVLSFAAAGLNLVLAAYVLSKNPRGYANRLFAALALALAVWAFGDAMYNVSTTVSSKAFWVRFQAPGEILFPVLFLNLALVFPRVSSLLRGRAGVAPLAIIYAPALFTLVSFYSTEWVFRFKPPGASGGLTEKGWLYWAYAVFAYALMLAALCLYVLNYRRSRRLREKRIAQVMVAAVAVPLVVNILENARLYTLSSTPCFFTVTAAVFAYGILRHQMFAEVEKVLKRSIVYFALTVLISSAYVLNIIITERFVRDYFSAGGVMATALFVFALVLIFEPLRRFLTGIVDRSFFRKDYEFGRMLADLSESLVELADLDRISAMITERLTVGMGLTGAALFYERRGAGVWLKKTVSGFVPEYARGSPAEVSLESGILRLRGAFGEARHEVLEVPLVFETEEVGVLLLGEKLSGYEFSFSDRSLLSAMAPQVAVALKNGALYQEVLRKQERVNELVGKLADAHEDERRRISRELHDGVAQSFLGVLYLSEFTLENLEGDIESAKRDLDMLNERAREGLEELRAVIDGLRPIPLEVLGLKGAAGKLVSDIASEGRIQAFLESNLEDDERLPVLLEGNLFRMLQEALNNVRRHSGAREVRVTLMREGGVLTMVVADDGMGMSPEASAGGRGHGMTGMEERAREIGGELVMRSEVDCGTEIRVSAPILRECEYGP